jgi:hypothetical protein
MEGVLSAKPPAVWTRDRAKASARALALSLWLKRKLLAAAVPPAAAYVFGFVAPYLPIAAVEGLRGQVTTTSVVAATLVVALLAAYHEVHATSAIEHERLSREAEQFAAKFREREARRPTFAFRVINDERPTPMMGKRTDVARWIRIEVENTSTVDADECSIELEATSPALAGFVRSPLAVTHYGTRACGILAGRRESFDVCWCFESHGTPDAYFCVPYSLPFARTAAIREIEVAFSARGLAVPIKGQYTLSWSGSALQVWEGRGLGVPARVDTTGL